MTGFAVVSHIYFIDTMANLQQLEEKLQQIKQQHLLQFYPSFSDEQKERFLAHLHNLDLEEAVNLFNRSQLQPNTTQDVLEIKPIPPSQFESEQRCNEHTLNKYRATGLEAVSRGEVGVLLMAGGQGTRLGVTYPKGMYPIGLPSGKTLFQIHAERIQRVEHLAKKLTGKSGKITWYIMTSGPTNEMTNAFLKSHAFFGLKPENVVQFKQGLLPCFGFNGNILLEKPDLVALAPDGNGGIYRALDKNGILQDMKNRGVKYIHAHSIDNILTKVADPIFIGYCIDKESDCGAKVVHKVYPKEAVGVVCQINGEFQVVEYSEISEELANMRNEKGDLVFSAGNICNHFFTRDFLEKIARDYEKKLKLHVAKKRISCVDSKGKAHIPDTVNGIKIEKFVFDVFQFSHKFVTWEVPRRSEFSAMKNSDSVGKECPSTARQDLLALHKTYIEQAGGVVENEVEISPLLSYTGEDLECRVKGKVFSEKTVLSADSENISINGGDHL